MTAPRRTREGAREGNSAVGFASEAGAVPVSRPRGVVNALAALVLAGILGYLYLKTEGVDVRSYNQSVTNLLKLKDIDGRWDVAVLQASLQSGEDLESLSISSRIAREVFGELEASTRGMPDHELQRGLENLKRELAQKIDLMEQFRDRAADLQPELARQILLIPSGARIDTLVLLLNRELQGRLDQQEVYRVYLVSYTAALLLLLAWFGSRLLQSYHLLEEANLGLEKRVQQRTRELSEALRQLKESETMLIQTEKMSSLGQMVAGVAHEINTPLAYVNASLESMKAELPHLSSLVAETDRLLGMLAAGESDEARLTAQFSRASEAARRFREHGGLEEFGKLVGDGLHGIGEISELVVNLKNFSRLDRSKVAKFNLNEGVESTLLIARHEVKHKTVNKRFGEIPPITCSPSQINQVLLNLINNAAQATPDEPKGVITLTTRREGAGQVAVEVEDNGHGIPQDVLPKVFDPFFTTKDVGRGTGLGLSIAYRIVQEHGGSIRVSSQPGVGTKFTVILPVEPPPASAA